MFDVDFFFFNDTAPPEIYTLSLHDALPIWPVAPPVQRLGGYHDVGARRGFHELADAHAHLRRYLVQPVDAEIEDRKSTRLNSSHANISYAVFCLKKKKKPIYHINSD